MNILKSVIGELFGMFVDDGALALLSLLLILAVAIAVHGGYLTGLAGAVLLPMGCLVILAESLGRAARSSLRKRR